MNIEEVTEFLRSEIAPRGNLLDRDAEALRCAYQAMADRGFLGFKVPKLYGGPEWGEGDFRRFQEECARASGALAFLQTQHQSACSLIAKSSNESLKTKWLPGMVYGKPGVGIAFSQLRRSGPPMMRVKEEGENLRFSGEIPWATGLGFFSHLLVAGTMDNGEIAFGIMPFEASKDVEISPPMHLAAMMSAQTVEMRLYDHAIPKENLVDFKPADWIKRNDLLNITLQGFFAVGCAHGAIDLVQMAGEKRNRPVLLETANALHQERLDLLEKLENAQATGDLTTDERLGLRAHAIELMMRCTQAAVVATGGSANSLDHPAQRYYREALVYAVSAQTEEIQAATLQRMKRFKTVPS